MLVSCTPAAPPIRWEAELLAILRKSKANNPALGVTGVLCFSEGIFLQVLEGGRSAVNRLYNRIAADDRHTQVELLSVRRDRRAQLCRLVDGAGGHGAAEPGAAAEVLRARHAGPLRGFGRRSRWRCSASWSPPRRSSGSPDPGGLAAPARASLAPARRRPLCGRLTGRDPFGLRVFTMDPDCLGSYICGVLISECTKLRQT
jgi:hypothetical protein